MELIKKLHAEKKDQQSSNSANEDFPINEDFKAKIPSEVQKREVCPTIDANIAFIKAVFGDGIGLIGRTYMMQNRMQIGLIFIDSITDKMIVSSEIIEPLLKENDTLHFGQDDILEALQTRVLFAPDATISDQMEEVFTALLVGSTILLLTERTGRL